MDGTVLKSFAILIASVGVVFLVLYALKRVSKRFTTAQNTKELKILSKLALSPKNQLFIVEADGKTLLLGVSEKSINALAELSDDQRYSSLETSKTKKTKSPTVSQNANANDLSFLSFLKSSIAKKSELNNN